MRKALTSQQQHWELEDNVNTFKKDDFQTRILYLARFSTKCKGGIRTFVDMQVSKNLPLQPVGS